MIPLREAIVNADKACGKCDSCQLRLKGFKETGQRDPISYEFYPKWYQKV